MAASSGKRKSPVHTNNNVEAAFDIVERIVQLAAFDNVAWAMLPVWTRLNTDGGLETGR